MGVRKARLADLAKLEALECAAFAHDRLSRRSLRAYILSPRVIMLVAIHERVLAGYSLVAFRKNSSVARLYSLAIAPEKSGRGLGGALLAASEKAARRRGAARLRLEVRVDNQPAIALYNKAGYRPFDKIDDYYEDGTSALRFEKDL
ncbi:GNAT family N-acetyltransferase [Beijerinckia indica]|uniref:GCN5-related N-acetyltransferase n=1 Tax=Beijerinckia indica subsp. indica (strain ATCC 9039 / DSM 1715 / NCIMB 8712) TaxID=395963 RepID=B2IIN2_BEII9|nr:GNAT family N-acetyltransferase [Beijerinckia indica]ACB94725.1 GCN5-related N-acetyltransferase [Beijerinckia indica subsp. indica ATCC 9039]